MNKFEQKVKLDNYKAHLQTIMGNITIANRELERIFAEIPKQREEFLSLMKSLSELRNESKTIKSNQLRASQELDSRSKRLDKGYEALEEDRLDIEAYIIAEKRSLGDYIKSLSNKVTSLEKEIEELDETKVSLMGNIETQTNILVNLERSILESTQKNSELKQLLETEQVNFNELVDSHKSTIETLNSEILQLRAIKEAELYSMIRADDYIQKKEESFRQREHDLQTINARLKALFKEVRPEIELKI